MIIVKTIKPGSDKFRIPPCHLSVSDFELQLDKLCSYLSRDQIDDFKYKLMAHLQMTSQYPHQAELLSTLHYFLIHFLESDVPKALIEKLASHLTFSSQHVHHYLEYLIQSIHPPKDIHGLFKQLFKYMQFNNLKQNDFFSIFNALLQMSSYTPTALWQELENYDLLSFTQNEQEELQVLFDAHASDKKKQQAIKKLILKTQTLDAYQQLLHFTNTSYQSHHFKHLQKIIRHPRNFDCALLHFQQLPFYTHQLDAELRHQLCIMTKSAQDAYRALVCLKPEEQLKYLKKHQSQLQTWVQSNTDLIRFLNILSPKSRLLVIKKTLASPTVLFEDFGPLMDFFQMLAKDTQKIYISSVKALPIKNGFQFAELLERIHQDNHEILLKRHPYLFLIRNSYELECVLYRLKPELRETFIQVVSPKLSPQTMQAESLIAILEKFDAEKREYILNIFQPHISNIITDGKQLCELLFCFEKNKRAQILKRFSKQEIEERLKDIYLINYVLITLPQQAKAYFVQEHLSHILRLVQKSDQLNALLHVLPAQIKRRLLKYFLPRLCQLFHNDTDFKLFLNEFPMGAYKQIVFLPELYSKFQHILEPIYDDLVKFHQIQNIQASKNAKQIHKKRNPT